MDNTGLVFMETLRKLKQLYTTKLSTAIEEENSREKQLEEIDEKLKNANKELAQIEQALKVLKDEKESTKQNRLDEINKLESEKKEQDDKANKESDETQSQFLKQLEEKEAWSDQMKEKLAHEKDQLKNKLTKIKNENISKEAEARKKVQKMQHKILDKIKVYDEEMKAHHERIERMDLKYSRQKEQLEDRQGRNEVLQAEKKRLDEENEKEEAMKNQFDYQQRLRDEAAAYIQAHWRGAWWRIDYEKKRKKRGKGGKKKAKKN